jgi:hypothetical protein
MNHEEATEIRTRAHAALIVEAKKRLATIQEQVSHLLQQQREMEREIAVLTEAQETLTPSVEAKAEVA